MATSDDRKEPGFSESSQKQGGNSPNRAGRPYAADEPPQNHGGNSPNRVGRPYAAGDSPEYKDTESTAPAIKLVAIAIFIACGLFIGDWLYQRYVEYRVAQELTALVEQWEAEAQASMERLEQEARARQQAQRRQRAQTTTGQWLAKNCADWRKSHREMQLPTSEAEMKRHCDLYEQFLRTGVPPAGVPR